ncbi:MAG: hypothetical protein KKF89_04560, partial [Nanoarchaeota archaeon]|nr:hypothetical protein [Nanoarchaeota archaeon]
EQNFKNYSVQIDNDIGFGSLNYYGGTYDRTSTSKQFGPLTDQRIWYWRVIAYDLADNSRISNQIFNYTTDTIKPTIILNHPENDYWINYFTETFYYNVTDFTNLQNCSIIINWIINKTNFTINNDQENNFTLTFSGDGTYNWKVECYDSANNRNESETRVLNIDQTPPTVFDLLEPQNNTLSNNKNPLLNWSQTTDDKFDNYTIQVSNTLDFGGILYIYNSFTLSNTEYQVADNWADGTYYWRVIAWDQGGNNRTSNQVFIYRVDATPPANFDLTTPADTTESTDLTPLLDWSQTSDDHFTNYTVHVSDEADFSYNNFTYSTFDVITTEYQVISGWSTNTIWYWYVTAYDNATNQKNSSQIFTYTTDTQTPVVNLVNPSPGETWTSSSTVNFQYNVTDFGTINNCTLVINGTDSFTDIVVEKETVESILKSLDNGAYNWSVKCVDKTGAIGYSENRLLSMNVIIPVQKLWETAVGGPFTTPAKINLSYEYDLIENSVLYDVPYGTNRMFINATHTIGGSGLILSAYSTINFSATFTGERANQAYISWLFYIGNSSGDYLVCNSGNNNTGGTLITSTSKSSYKNTCTSQLEEVILSPDDTLRLEMIVYQGSTQPRTYTHYWDNADDSWVVLEGYKLGVMQASFVNVSDPYLGEGEGFVEQCNVTCVGGDCMNTMVYLQYNDSVLGWTNLGLTGNVVRNSTQANPVMLGTISNSVMTNFSLIGEIYSFDNQIRCVAVSDYTNFTTSYKNITVTDKIDPNVTLVSPDEGDAFDPQEITFIYKPYDVRLQNCTLWGNFTGVWNYTNQTNSSPLNNENNNFVFYLSYGKYSWNVKCYDEADNGAFAGANRTIIIAGDVAITSSGITFSNSDPVEGENITIFANVTNNANKNETGVIVQFWNGDPDSGGTQINGNKLINLSPLGHTLTNTTWKPLIGNYNIYVVVDPPYGSGNIIEADETNNKDYTSIFVDSWQIFFGQINGTLFLENNLNSNYSLWFDTNVAGNIYVTDTDTISGISWQYLRALTRNTTGYFDMNTLNDFANVDTNLGSTNYLDSVNKTFSQGGVPKATDSFKVYQRLINSVPVVNSTNTNNFITGILWDSDDSSNAYYDTTDDEDLVFVTKINENKVGAYGTYDYEIKIPSNLKSYKGGATTVTLYYELA